MTAVLRVAILVLFALATFAPLSSRAQDETPEAECVETTPEENLAIVETYWQEFVWGKQGKLADVVAEDEVHHWGIGPDTSGFEPFMERVQRISSSRSGSRAVLGTAVTAIVSPTALKTSIEYPSVPSGATWRSISLAISPRLSRCSGTSHFRTASV